MGAHKANDRGSPTVVDRQVRPLIPYLLGRDAARVVFELHGVASMDASGLGAVPDSRRKAVEAGGLRAAGCVSQFGAVASGVSRRIWQGGGAKAGRSPVESPTTPPDRMRSTAQQASRIERRALAAPSSLARRLLTLSGPDRVFLTFDSLDEAVAAPAPAAREPAS
jgi:hypothetical protein